MWPTWIIFSKFPHSIGINYLILQLLVVLKIIVLYSKVLNNRFCDKLLSFWKKPVLEHLRKMNHFLILHGTCNAK